jgi:hypothetical protein
VSEKCCHPYAPGIMKSLMPPGGDKVFRKLFPTTKWSLELNAVITKAGMLTHGLKAPGFNP